MSVHFTQARASGALLKALLEAEEKRLLEGDPRGGEEWVKSQAGYGLTRSAQLKI